MRGPRATSIPFTRTRRSPRRPAWATCSLTGCSPWASSRSRSRTGSGSARCGSSASASRRSCGWATWSPARARSWPSTRRCPEAGPAWWISSSGRRIRRARKSSRARPPRRSRRGRRKLPLLAESVRARALPAQTLGEVRKGGVAPLRVNLASAEKVAERGLRGWEGQLVPRNVCRIHPLDPVVLGTRPDLASHHARPVHDDHDRRARVGVDAQHTAKIHLESRLLPRLADRTLLHGLAPVHEAAGKRPLAARRLDGP